MSKEVKEETGKETHKRRKHLIKVCCAGDEDVDPDKIHAHILKLGEELGERSNVVMTRLNDADVQQIDALVEVEVFKSRSEAAAFFIKEGMKAREDLFQKVMPTVDKIRVLKEQAKKSLSQEATE